MMHVVGIDFTSSPSSRKPITALHCNFDHGVLSAETLEERSDYGGFEDILSRPGPWIAGIDFPFSLSRRFIENIGWPTSWERYVRQIGRWSRAEFRLKLEDYKVNRAKGDKEHRRNTDKQAGSLSPQKLHGIPVGLMLFEGAPRLLAAGVTIPHMHEGDPSRIVVEAYPGIVARKLVGRRSYKNDAKRKQTEGQRAMLFAILQRLAEEASDRYGFRIIAPPSLCEDPSADHLDALLCAVQAAWAWAQREAAYGAPTELNPVEGWIADPHLAPISSARS